MLLYSPQSHSTLPRIAIDFSWPQSEVQLGESRVTLGDSVVQSGERVNSGDSGRYGPRMSVYGSISRGGIARAQQLSYSTSSRLSK